MAIRVIIGTITAAQKDLLRRDFNSEVVKIIKVNGLDAVQIKYSTTSEVEKQLAAAVIKELPGSKLLGAIQKL